MQCLDVETYELVYTLLLGTAIEMQRSSSPVIEGSRMNYGCELRAAKTGLG